MFLDIILVYYQYFLSADMHTGKLVKNLWSATVLYALNLRLKLSVRILGNVFLEEKKTDVFSVIYYVHTCFHAMNKVANHEFHWLIVFFSFTQAVA
jgi:hypothetical protein